MFTDLIGVLFLAVWHGLPLGTGKKEFAVCSLHTRTCCYIWTWTTYTQRLWANPFQKCFFFYFLVFDIDLQLVLVHLILSFFLPTALRWIFLAASQARRGWSSDVFLPSFRWFVYTVRLNWTKNLINSCNYVIRDDKCSHSFFTVPWLLKRFPKAWTFVVNVAVFFFCSEIWKLILCFWILCKLFAILNRRLYAFKACWFDYLLSLFSFCSARALLNKLIGIRVCFISSRSFIYDFESEHV